jgi:hypothetical protein
VTLTFTLLTVIIAGTAVLALVDAVQRLRHRGSSTVLAVIELVLGVALGLTFFVVLPAPTLTIAIALEVVLVLSLVFRGKGGRRSPNLTVIALILNTLVLLVTLGWIAVPGLI